MADAAITTADFQAKIDQINQNTTASARAAQSLASFLGELRTKLDKTLTDAGVPAEEEKKILDQLEVAAQTSGALKTFLEATAVAPTAPVGSGGNEPTPVAVPNTLNT